MGKKSRKKKNKKTTGTATVTAIAGGNVNAKIPTVATLTLPMPCYHGSNLAAFQNREYMQCLHAIIRDFGKDNIAASIQKWEDDYKHLIELDTCFHGFIFAICTHLYLKDYHSTVFNQMEANELLSLGIGMRYSFEKGSLVDLEFESGDKVVKYMRDIFTERGVIKCLARETPCDCMDSKKLETKGMEKTNVCLGCRKLFQKTTLSACTGCQIARYCSKACQVNAWPKHRDLCKILQQQRVNKSCVK